jgi:hypothetical protein
MGSEADLPLTPIGRSNAPVAPCAAPPNSGTLAEDSTAEPTEKNPSG